MKKSTAQKILIFLLAYFLIGLVMQYIGLQLSCQNPLYTCISVKEYLTDPYLFQNTVVWPLIFIGGLDKANVLF